MTECRTRNLWLCINGASHSSRLRFEIGGLPGGFVVDHAELARFMKRRAPGRSAGSTARRERDEVHFECERGGVFRGFILNEDARPGDYAANRAVPRPGHADFPQYLRFGRIPSGGGQNSGRLTAALCAAGGICLQYLKRRGITVAARLIRSGDIAAAKKAGDSVGGVIECEARGIPAGIGGPLFDGLDGEISRAVFAIPGVKGIEFGNGFAAAELKGTENNDVFVVRDGEVRTRTNRHGGILGGYSSGMPVVFRVAMKPTPTVFGEQESVDLGTMKSAKLVMKGRHDACIAVRAVPVVEAMAAFALAAVVEEHDRRLPRICLTLTGRTLAEDLGQYRSQRLFTDMVELRVDLLEENELAAAADFPKRVKVPVILTCRRVRDGGAWNGSERARAALLKRLLAEGGFAYVDLERDFHLCDGATGGARVIRSLHCEGLKPLRDLKTGKPGEILKFAVRLKSLREIVRLREFALSLEGDHVVMATGRQGFVTRALAGCFGSRWVYASIGGLEELGHVSPEELVRTYRFRDISVAAPDRTGGCEVGLYGVTGWPLTRTRSPEINNAAFAEEDERSLMVPLPAEDIADAIAFAKEFRFNGLAVTIPHKETVMKLLDRVDRVAKAVGAVNTVKFVNGKSVGYNTDVEGFTRALREFTRPRMPGRVALLGNGGAAKACRYALKKLGAKVMVVHRRPLTGEFGLIVNATPVDPIPEYRFRGDELVFDLRYEPEETELMARARAAGCRVTNGLQMLRYQAEGQRIMNNEG